MHVIQWNGIDIPAELRELPPGMYVIERVDEGVVATKTSDNISTSHVLDSLQSKLGRAIELADLDIDITVTRAANTVE